MSTTLKFESLIDSKLVRCIFWDGAEFVHASSPKMGKFGRRINFVHKNEYTNFSAATSNFLA